MHHPSIYPAIIYPFFIHYFKHQQFIHHPFTIHLTKHPFILHLPSLPYPSLCIRHQTIIHLCIYSIPISHQSIYRPHIHSFSQPSIYFIYLSFIHYSSVHHSAAINSHPPYLMHSLGPHPSILPASIHLFISHLSIHYSICHLSIHHFSCTKYPSNLYFSFISSYLSFISQTSTHQFIFHLFLFHPLSIFYSFFH